MLSGRPEKILDLELDMVLEDFSYLQRPRLGPVTLSTSHGLLLALVICALLFIPIDIVMAITNQHRRIYLICQLVGGALFPGRLVANIVFVVSSRASRS